MPQYRFLLMHTLYPGSGIWNSGNGIWNSGIREVESGMQGVEFGIQRVECRIQKPPRLPRNGAQRKHGDHD